MLYISSDFPFKRTDFILYQFEVCGKIVRHVQFAEWPCPHFPLLMPYMSLVHLSQLPATLVVLDFPECPFLFRVPSRRPHGIAGHVSWGASRLWALSDLPCCWCHFEECRSDTGYDAPLLEFVWCFSHDYTGIVGSGRTITEVPLSSHPLEGTHCPHNVWVLMLTLITEPRSSSPGFPTFRLLFASLPVLWSWEESLCIAHT